MIDDKQILKMVSSKSKKINLAICAEECSELIKEITKVMRYGSEYPKERLVEEMADVRIILSMLQIMENVSDDELKAAIESKMERNMKRLISPIDRVQACGDGLVLFKTCMMLIKEQFKYQPKLYQTIVDTVKMILSERQKNSLEEANILLLSKLKMNPKYASCIITYDSFHKMLELTNFDLRDLVENVSIGESKSTKNNRGIKYVYELLTQSKMEAIPQDRLVRKGDIANVFPQLFDCGEYDNLSFIERNIASFEVCIKRITSYYSSVVSGGSVLLEIDDIGIDYIDLGYIAYHISLGNFDVVDFKLLSEMMKKSDTIREEFPNVENEMCSHSLSIFIYGLLCSRYHKVIE